MTGSLGIGLAADRLPWKDPISLQPAIEWYGFYSGISIPIPMRKIQQKELRTGGFARVGPMSISEM
jgi:hypothetical protein